MNKSILILISDFLILSILSLASFDTPVGQQQQTPQQQGATQVPDTTDVREDLMDVLKLALEEERASREELRQSLGANEQRIREQEELLRERERRLAAFQQQLQQKELEAQKLESERSSLQEQYVNTQASVRQLQNQLTNVVSEARLSSNRLAALHQSLEQEQAAAAQLKQHLQQLESQYKMTDEERAKLNAALQVSEAEKRIAREQIESMRGEVQTVRSEKAQIVQQTEKLSDRIENLAHQSTSLRQEIVSLAQHSTNLSTGIAQLTQHSTNLSTGIARLTQHSTNLGAGIAQLTQQSTNLGAGIAQLTQQSTNLAQEIRENRPLAANTIFNDFIQNRVLSRFEATRRGIFGQDVDKKRESKTVLVRDRNRIYALLHVKDTPINLQMAGSEWEWIGASLYRSGANISAPQISFLYSDPRVILLPLTEVQARQFGINTYDLSEDPFKFQEGIVIGADEGYYGECRFQIEQGLPQYVKMDRSMVKGLFGKFNPSKGDLVFSRTGQLLGIMVNNDYCVLLKELGAARGLRTGADIGTPQAIQLLSQLRFRLETLPARLQ